jgi:hypothetical protein
MLDSKEGKENDPNCKLKLCGMASLKPPDSHQLLATAGWIGRGDWREASEELEKITPQSRAHPDALTVRLLIYSKAEK